MGAARADGTARPGIGGRGPFGKTMRPVGSEYVGKDGYIMVKVAPWPSKPGSKDNWKLKHKHVWEQANGREVPRGHVVMFKDRDTRNFDPANLACVPRGIMQRMNDMASKCPDLRWRDAETFDAVLAMAEVSIAAYRAEQTRERRCSVCGRMFKPDVYEREGTVTATNRKTCRACLDAGRRGHGEV